MLDVKKFKDTETRKFFVSNTLKLKRTTTTCVIIEDSLGQELRVYKDEFVSFIMDNNIHIKDNILDEYLIIDRKGNFCKAEEYDNWLIQINSIKSFDKNDLKVGQCYLLNDGFKVIYLGSFYQGKYHFSPYSYHQNFFSFANVYKKDIFIRADRLEIKSFFSDSFVYNISNKIISVENEAISKEEINNIVDALKLSDTYFYFSEKKCDISRRKLLLKEITLDELKIDFRRNNCFRKVFKMFINYPDYTFLFDLLFKEDASDKNLDYYLNNLSVESSNNIFLLEKETFRRLPKINILEAESTFTEKTYVIDLD